jgi:pSer/pThr/pTyr-binding forkhead associated (FHA) protein
MGMVGSSPAMHPPPQYGAPQYGAPPMGVPPGGHDAKTMAPQMSPAIAGAIGAPPSTTPGMIPPSAAGSTPKPAGQQMITCPRCGTPTPVGFAYCQQCGLHMQAMQPTDPGQLSGPRAAVKASPSNAIGNPGVDPMMATLAHDGPRAGQIAPPPAGAPPGAPAPVAIAPSGPIVAPATAAASGPAWGQAVLVNRDGTDGQRFNLAGEYAVVGRAGADIAFDDDRFLARQHARFERGGDGNVRVHSLDTLNGVFKKADLPIDLVDGMTILVGREVLRFEKVDPEEVRVHPLIRHGVALFGSPPREPWGRFVQIIPSGGYRDVRHLSGEEIVLGREEGDIVFRDDAFMSRRHAAVTWDGKKAQITDLGSSNGTFVRITGPTAIKNGDHVRMGDQLLRIELGK